MSLWFIVTMLVVTAVWCVAVFFRSRYLLHMMQLEGYKNDNFLKWMAENKAKVYPRNLTVGIGLIVVVSMFLGAIKSEYIIYIYSLVWIVGVLLSVNFKAEKMGINIKGVVENMSYIICDGCNKKLKIFSKKSAEEHAEYLGIPLIGELPMDLGFTEALEEGNVEQYVLDNPLYSLIFEGLY